MKLNKKKLFVAALAISLVAIISAGSLAWFSDSDEVTNNFYIATSEDDEPDEIFSIDVWEKTPDEDKDQDGHEYKDILPGDVLKKEVNVENTGYYDQYVRVTVTVSDAAAWMGALNVTTAPRLDKITDWDANGNWVDYSVEIVNDELVYVMYYKNILLGDQDSMYDNAGVHQSVVTLFTKVMIPESMTVDQAAAFKNNFAINVKAEAVQTENLGLDRTNGDGALEAFAKVGI